MSKIHVQFSTGDPVEYEEGPLHDLWAQGRIPEGTQYWREGMPAWQPIKDLFPTPADGPGNPVGTTGDYNYVRDPGKLTSWLVLMLKIMLGFHIFSALSGFGQIIMLKVVFIRPLALVLDASRMLLGIPGLIVSLLTAVAFLMWIHRANVNSRGFGAVGMKISPGWSVGWYFIPFANLVMPLLSMREILQVSRDPARWNDQKGGPLLAWWWGLWLASGLLGNAAILIGQTASTRDDLLDATALSSIATSIGVALCIVAIKLVKTIASNQETLVS